MPPEHWDRDQWDPPGIWTRQAPRGPSQAPGVGRADGTGDSTSLGLPWRQMGLWNQGGGEEGPDPDEEMSGHPR